MKTENIYMEPLKREVTFHIGKTQSENFEVIDKGKPTDLWFHAKDISSCHVICEMPDNLSKKDRQYIIKVGALLCKSNTNKIKSINNVEIIYTFIKNVTKTYIQGCVVTQNTKIIKC
jgi:predicted ribosome quality control (RQC) complex YloA/Tae2 family protein